MRTKIFTVLFLVVVLFTACAKKTNAKVANEAIPDDAIPFEYNEKMQKVIVLNGLLNDSIPMRIIFDTGCPGGILVSDSLKGKLAENVDVKIGKFKTNMPVFYKDKNWPEFTHYLGSNGAVISWKFFEDKILKISFEHKYIQVLENLNDEVGYDSLQLKKHPTMNFMMAPINVYLQGKIIPLDLMFDTGANNYASHIEPGLASPYSLNLDSAKYDKGSDPYKKGFIIKADSIGFGKYNVPTRRVGVTFYPSFENNPYISGLLGTQYMENFELILDFKKFVLYIKPRTTPVVDKLEWSFFK